MYKLSQLKNGLSLITVPVKGTKAVTVLALFPVGSRYETNEEAGTSHFIEHMLFKGTVARPNAQQISRALDSVGAEYNAFTSQDYTGYYVKIDSRKQALAFDILADIIYNSVFDESEIQKESGAIMEEMRLYEDNPSMAIDHLADVSVFGSHPLGREIVGTKETVQRMTRAKMWNYYQRHYSPATMVLVVAGNVNSAKMLRWIRNFALPLHGADQAKPHHYKQQFEHFVWPKTVPSLPDRVQVKNRVVDQAQLILSFPGLKADHADRFALSVLLVILGVGMSSRLFTEVREKRGLVYMIHAESGSFRDVGVWQIQAGADPARLQEALQVIKSEVRRLAREPITAAELLAAQNNIMGRLALSLEDSNSQAEWYAKQFFFASTIRTPEQVTQKLKQVSLSQLQRVARDLCRWEEVRVAAIGPFTKGSIIDKLKALR